MIVDMGRTAFIQDMQFDEAGLWIAPVRFYFANDNAQVFPGAHLFGTDYFESHVDCNVGPGLRWDSERIYDKGAPVSGITGQGPPCGSLDWWQNGVPSDAPSLAMDAQGRSLCCRPVNSDFMETGPAVGFSRQECQTWRVFGPPNRTLTDLTAGVSWNRILNTTTAVIFRNPTTFSDTMRINWHGFTCGPYAQTTPPTLVFGSPHPNAVCGFLTYHPGTFRGLYQAPATAFHYANHIFAFVNPY